MMTKAMEPRPITMTAMAQSGMAFSSSAWLGWGVSFGNTAMKKSQFLFQLIVR